MKPAVLFVCAAALCAQLPSVGAVEATSEIFPSLRKKREKAKLAAAQQAQSVAPVDISVPEVPAAVAAIPDTVDAGTEGYPVLPEVSQMLSEASGTLKSVSSQASVLQGRVMQAQMQSEGKMAKQKAAFEEKLKAQELGNRAVIQANANITAEIKNLQNDNNDLRKHARSLEETNHVMRTELHTLQARLLGAKEFTQDSLKATDDSKSALLSVLQDTSNKRKHRRHVLLESSSRKTVKNDDVDDDDDSDDSDKSDDDSDDQEDSDGTSLLALSMKTTRVSTAANSEAGAASTFEAAMSDLEAAVPGASAPVFPKSEADPGDLLEVLSKNVAHLAEQEKASEKHLKELFITDFRAGAKRHSALLIQQKSLIATRSSLQALQANLKTAVAHLESTEAHLQSRLRGLGQYLQKMAHLALAPEKEAPRLLEALPKAPTFKEPQQATS